MKALNAIRRWLAGALAVGMAVAAIGMPAYLVTIDSRFHQKARGQEDDVTRAIRRMQPVVWAHPGQVQLGYLSDLPLWSYPWMERYFRAQLALAPHVLHDRPGVNQVVVIDAIDDQEATHLAAGRHLTRLRRVGEGVFIGQRASP